MENDILSILNPQQRQAVTAGTGPVLVLAGPGSGKTRVLTHRIAYVIENLGVQPHKILAVTFTNKAAREMEARVERLLETKMKGAWLGTFHSVCARILRREAEYLPFNANFVIYDEDDQISVVKRAMKELNIDEKQNRPNRVLAAISRAKNNLIFPEHYVPPSRDEQNVEQIYKRYNDLLIESNAVDFDDLLLWTWRLLEDKPLVREAYSKKFEYVLVDEFQDTNQSQYELLRHLSYYHQNIFVVGDEDQSIYRWRGADYRNVLRFEEDYPKSQKILLEQNYRSTQVVLDAASAVINKNVYRTPKRLRALPELGEGVKITFHEADDDREEAAYVTAKIMELINSGQYQGGDFAVMYRTNAQSRLLEEAFFHAKIPYRIVGAQRFYGRREIKDLIAYLRLAQNPSDFVSLARVINVPKRGIGEKALTSLQATAQASATSVGNVLIEISQKGKESPHWNLLPRGVNVLADFGAMLSYWHEHIDSMPLADLFDRILEDIGYFDYLNDGSEEGLSRWENVQELRRLALDYEEQGLAGFLERLALVSDQDTMPVETEAPTLLTLHASKGLEFPVVFIVGLDEGIIPHNRSIIKPATKYSKAEYDLEEVEEERRLFYVGITRAKNRLFLVHALRRSIYGSYQDTIYSNFIEDIPEKLFRGKKPVRLDLDERRERTSRWNSDTPVMNTYRTPPPAQSAPIIQQQYRHGMRVQHPTWGEGLVLGSKILDGDEIVDVEFRDTVGLKHLVASLANLEILS